jgi:hypothetical protein
MASRQGPSCDGLDPFTEDELELRLVLEACGRCPIRQSCRASWTGAAVGVWGGQRGFELAVGRRALNAILESVVPPPAPETVDLDESRRCGYCGKSLAGRSKATRWCDRSCSRAGLDAERLAAAR